MTRLSQKEIIRKLLRDDPEKWWFSYDLQKIGTKYGWLGTSGDRRARELRKAGILESKPSGQYEMYKYKPTRHEILSEGMKNMIELRNEKETIIKEIKEQGGLADYSRNDQKIPTLFAV